VSAVKERPVQKNGHFAVAQRATIKEKKIRRTYARVPWARFTAACQVLDRDPYKIVEEIGYTYSVASDWSRRGDCPLVAVLVVEGLVSARKLRLDLNETRALVKKLETDLAAKPEVKPEDKPSRKRSADEMFMAFPTLPVQIKGLEAICQAYRIPCATFSAQEDLDGLFPEG
jgi:hypothetical protein